MRAIERLRALGQQHTEMWKATRYKPGEVRRRDDGTFWQKPANGGKLVQVADASGTSLGKREGKRSREKGLAQRRAYSAEFSQASDAAGLTPPVHASEYSAWKFQSDDLKEAIPLREFVEVMRSHGAVEAVDALATLARSRGLAQKRGKWRKA